LARRWTHEASRKFGTACCGRIRIGPPGRYLDAIAEASYRVSEATRLERALAIYLDCQAVSANDARIAAVLQQHPDLRDLLEPLLCPEAVEAAVDEAARPKVLGDFELQRELGRGGMGVVHEARQRSLGRRVALKLLAPEFAADPSRVARFRREATTLAQLGHPHVVRVFDAGTDDGQPWLAMELIEGESLDHRLQRWRENGGHRDGSLRQVVSDLLLVANALAHVHQLGILHRDVKPANVLFAADGSPRLTDFGLARPALAPSLTQAGVLAGTPHYLAPEYVQHGTANAQGDVWALGASLYEAITLQRPFAVPTDLAVLQRVLHDDPVDPRRLSPGLPNDLAAIVLRALEKDPARRYPTMAAFAADVQAFLDLRPTVARPLSRWRRLRRWVRREPWRAALAVVAALATSLGAYLLARLETLRAGEAVANAAAYESAIAEGFLRRTDGRRELAEAAAATARRLRPMAGEAIVVEVLQTLRFDSEALALQRLDAAVAEPHDDDEACRWLRVLILGRLGQRDEAERLATELGEPRSQMSLLLAAGRLVDTQQPAELERARELVSLATRLGPPRLLVHIQWAVLTRPHEERECAEALLRLWPEHPFVLHTAAARLQKYDPARALALQQQALAAGLDDTWARYNLAMYAMRAGDRALAATTAHAVLLDTKLPDERCRMLLQVLGDVDPARREGALLDWIQREPQRAMALAEAGFCAHERGDVAAAAEWFERALAADPAQPRALQGTALVQQDRGEHAAAMVTVDRLLEIDAGNEGAHALRLHGLRATGASEPAIRTELRRYATAIRKAPAWHALAEAAIAAQDWADALSALHSAEAVEDDRAAALTLRLQVHEAAGDATAAAHVRALLEQAQSR
jgi:tetratricopeptide (TPR) repeat protein